MPWLSYDTKGFAVSLGIELLWYRAGELGFTDAYYNGPMVILIYLAEVLKGIWNRLSGVTLSWQLLGDMYGQCFEERACNMNRALNILWLQWDVDPIILRRRSESFTWVEMQQSSYQKFVDGIKSAQRDEAAVHSMMNTMFIIDVNLRYVVDPYIYCCWKVWRKPNIWSGKRWGYSNWYVRNTIYLIHVVLAQDPRGYWSGERNM